MPYSIDTRTLQPGDTYVAIRGEKYDGHDFIPRAVEKGATGIVTEVEVASEIHEAAEVFRVESTLEYLIAQATAKIRTKQPDIVAITGSMGKTTTRTAILAVLREQFPAVSASGNLNTPLGISLLVLNSDLSPETKLVLEMGARLPGDIRELCGYFPPKVSVVTNVRGVHVETFGSIEGVQREKSELVRALDAGGTACLNGDDPRVLAMADVTQGHVMTYGKSEACDVRPDRITATLPILGEPATYVALAAMSVGLAFGMSEDAINRGLEKMRPEKGRLNRLRGRADSILIDDTYNASPDATLAALDVLANQEGTRRIAFLGDMLELGATEVEEHARVLSAATRSADVVHAVGKIMGQAIETLPEAERARITHHSNSADLAKAIRSGQVFTPQAGDVMLVKGSQGTRMERISEALLHPDLDPAAVLPRQTVSWKQI